jgi:hypothetical protein
MYSSVNICNIHKKKLYQLLIFKKIEWVGLTIYKILEVGLIIIMNLNPAQLCP